MRKTTPFLVLAPMLALPGLYPMAQHLPAIMLPVILLALTGALYAIMHSQCLKPWLNTPWPIAILISTLAFATLFNHQPIPTFLPTAWNQLIRPLCNIGLLHLLTPLSLAFTVWAMRITNHPWLQINRFALCLFTGLLMWPDSAADLPALGLLILSLTLLLTRQRISGPELAACVLLIATAATARSIFIYLPLLFGFSLVAVWPRRALQVTFGSLALLALFNPTLPTFPPIDFTSPTTIAATTLLLIVLIQSVYHWRWWPAHQHAAWGLGAPLFIVALSNLSETASLAHWYGAIYLAPALPVITYTLLRPTFKHS